MRLHSSEGSVVLTTPTRPETVPELAKRLGVPTWRVRRVCDALAEAHGGCPRVCKLFRLIGPELAEAIRAELARRGLVGDGGAGSGTARVEEPGPCGETTT